MIVDLLLASLLLSVMDNNSILNAVYIELYINAKNMRSADIQLPLSVFINFEVNANPFTF